MKRVTETETREIIGGGAGHCTVCHAYYGLDTRLSTLGMFIHTKLSTHKKAVKDIGYGHNCCKYASRCANKY